LKQKPETFWDISVTELLRQLQTGPQGLSNDEARQRLESDSGKRLKPKRQSNDLVLLLNQFKSPIIVILLFAAGLSFFLHDPTDAIIILSIVFLSGILGFWQERGAVNAVARLLAMVQTKAKVFRDGNATEIPYEEVVCGDIVLCSAGGSIPGDCIILESRDLFVNEAAMTGETYPVEKMPGTLTPVTPLGKRSNMLFMGTHVVTGTGKAVVVHTGIETEFGKISERLKLRPPETEFERGIRRFGFFLMEITLVLVVAIFAVNVFLQRAVLDSFLFALALAVGLTPQLLPAIISINLSHGANRMAQEKVIVKRLSSIENFGSMNVLCSDKSGTLTEGVVRIHSAQDSHGNESEKVLLFAYLNAFYETGFSNPIDDAIRNHKPFDLSGWGKIDELPYDFIRKRLSILVSNNELYILISKGAPKNVLAICSFAELSDGTRQQISEARESIQQRYEALSSEGYRTLGIAVKEVNQNVAVTKELESDMTFLGFLVFYDPPKEHVVDTIRQLRELGVTLKIITGDNHLVASQVSLKVGLPNQKIITGTDLRLLSDESLMKQVDEIDIFSEIEPNQKERIILALKKSGNVVGYMGDGINDASALHSADVGISVDSAVDVAKGSADIVLLEKDLSVLTKGIHEGRMTFANTLKYVFMATSANFGNMFSMAGASLFLPFLPLLPKQILLTNLLTDFPEMTIAKDNVDPELVEKPRSWNIKFIKDFMITFGALSSVFDYMTFGVLMLVLNATTEQFRTAWFVESVISASLIVLVIRSRKPFFRSKPGGYLLTATFATVGLTLAFPFTPLGKIFGFTPLPIVFFLLMGFIIAIYILAAETLKKTFFQRERF
jgi:Mg2+-importing ATPase